MRNQLSVKQQNDEAIVLKDLQHTLKTKAQRIANLLADVEAARGIVLEKDREAWFIHRLVKVDNISFEQIDRAELWLLKGNRTYMGEDRKKLLYSDFYPDPAQLRSVAGQEDRFFTKEALHELTKNHYNNGFRDGRLSELNKKAQNLLPVTAGDAAEHLGSSNLRLQLEVQTLTLSLAAANAKIREYEEEENRRTTNAFVTLFGVEPKGEDV